MEEMGPFSAKHQQLLAFFCICSLGFSERMPDGRLLFIKVLKENSYYAENGVNVSIV